MFKAWRNQRDQMLDIGANNTEKVQKAIAESERLIKSSMCKILYLRSQVIE